MKSTKGKDWTEAGRERDRELDVIEENFRARKPETVAAWRQRQRELRSEITARETELARLRRMVRVFDDEGAALIDEGRDVGGWVTERLDLSGIERPERKRGRA